LIGITIFYSAQGRLQQASEAATQCLGLAQRAHDPTLLVAAHAILGQIEQNLGHFTAARRHLEQALALYDERQLHSSFYGYDPRIFCLTVLAHGFWILGYPDQALAKSHEAIMAAEAQGHPFTLVSALGNAAIFHQYRREEQNMLACIKMMSRLCAEQEIALWATVEQMLQGWALAEQGQVNKGVTQIRQGLLGVAGT
jgi:predicted ATPase